MPRPPEEVLHELVAATEEGKATIRDLHSARAGALDVDKKQRERITQLIVEEVTRQVGAITDDARDELRTGITKVIEDFAAELHKKLLG